MRAHSRLWTDHVRFVTRPKTALTEADSRALNLLTAVSKVNRHIVPAFYLYLQAQESPKQIEGAQELQNQISKLLAVVHPSGPFFLGPQLSYVDVQLAPWIIRMRRVLTPYRGWPQPEEGSRWAAWVDAIEQNEHVKATTSTDDLYLDSYERYAGQSFANPLWQSLSILILD